MSLGSITRNRRCVWSKPRLRRSLFVKLAALLAMQASAADAEQPLWELGMGVFPNSFPNYRGAEDQQYYLLPLPYVVYRGDILRVDREGIRARLFDSDRVQINLSLNGAIPVESDSEGARRGMPDLDPTFEIGPSLNVRLANPSPQQQLHLRLPVRAVVATDFAAAEQVGWLFHPQINLDSSGVAGGWNVGLTLGPLFATRDYHAYYYDVKPEFATATRPVYRAASGYSCTAAVLGVSRRYDRLWLGGFVRYDYLAGAEFDDSPLVETDHSAMAGLAVAWIFAKSPEMVAR